MDRIREASNLVKELNAFKRGEIDDYVFIKIVCSYFDKIKDLKYLSPSDLKFLKFISNIVGIPHYYDLLSTKFMHDTEFNNFDLNTFSSLLYESSLHTNEKIKIHKYQKYILNKFQKDNLNRFFLSASTSFGKTYLIYEIMKKMNYKNIILIFPTIALLSENYEKLILDPNYKSFRNNFSIHTLSDIEEITDKNIFLFTPERYLSFIDKNINMSIDFVFVDEIYKIDNEYLIDEENKENERDTAYRVGLYHILLSQSDVLLAEPYIKLPDITNTKDNQSFNRFLSSNKFVTVNFNNIEIVNKIYKDIFTHKKHIVDEELTIDLKGFSNKSVGVKLSQVVSGIKQINQNMILYTKGPSTVEKKAKDIIKCSKSFDFKKDDELEELINHLVNSFNLTDWVVIESLRHKIGIHHGLIPKYIQKEIINLFNNGHIDILISTTTITEGVNTSAKNLIVLSGEKGPKPLKKFDAKNIAGRAGRFLHHYSGRVLIFNKKFRDIINGEEDEIRHKNYDTNTKKDELDYFITNDEYLNQDDLRNKELIEYSIYERGIPFSIMQSYKVISYSDKLKLYDRLINLQRKNNEAYAFMKNKIKALSYNLAYFNFDAINLILWVIKPIINNDKLNFFISTTRKLKKKNKKNRKDEYPILIYMLSSYLKDGYIGSINYNLSNSRKIINKETGKVTFKKLTTDEAIRESSTFIYNTLKYQLVKYLGVFNLIYKFHESKMENKDLEDIKGIDRLLKKLEYNATSELGKIASDYGVPSKIIEYYDDIENSKDIKKTFDSYELKKFEQIDTIINLNK